MEIKKKKHNTSRVIKMMIVAVPLPLLFFSVSFCAPSHHHHSPYHLNKLLGSSQSLPPCGREEGKSRLNNGERKPASSPSTSTTTDSSTSSQSTVLHQLDTHEETPNIPMTSATTFHLTRQLTDRRPSFKGPYKSGKVFLWKS